MSLLGVLQRATTGLNAFTSGLENLSNNVANVNTTGFKANELFYSELNGQENRGSALGENDGSEIGQGVAVAGGSIMFSQGDIVDTGNNTDLAIDGNGLFILQQDSGETVYSRAGQFSLDSDGVLIDPKNGFKVQMMGEPGELSDINLRSQLVSPPIATSVVQIQGQLDNTSPEGTLLPTAESGDNFELEVFDANGNASKIYLQFTKELGSRWRVDYLDKQGAIIAPHHTINFGVDNAPTTDTITDDISFELFDLLDAESIAQNFRSNETITIDAGNIDAADASSLTLNDGKFITRDGEKISYSDTGVYKLDDQGFLVDADTGFRVAASTEEGKLEDVKLELSSDATATTSVMFNGNIFEDSAVGVIGSVANPWIDNAAQPSFSVFDEEGGSQEVKLEFTRLVNSDSDRREFDVKAFDANNSELSVDGNLVYIRTGSNNWALLSGSETLRVTNTSADVNYEFDINFVGNDENSGLALTSNVVNTFSSQVADGRTQGQLSQVSFDSEGRILTQYDNGGSSIGQLLALATLNGQVMSDLSIDFNALSALEFVGENQASIAKIDGRATGQLVSFAFAQTGEISLVYSNGDELDIGSVALAYFTDQSVLKRYGDSMFQSTDNSQRTLGTSKDDIFGSLNAQSVELSNVNLSEEFADIIIVQRGFQASSQVLNVTNELIEELYNSISGR